MAAAAASFAQSGYHRVGIDDVAQSVGITGGAIYWHFDTKQALLAHAVFDGIALLEDAVEAPTLEAMLRSLVTVAIERRDLAILVQRESRHLQASDRLMMRNRVRTLVQQVTAALRASRRDLSGEEADFLARSAFSVLGSVSYHRASLRVSDLEHLVYGMASTVVAAVLPPSSDEEGGAASRNADGAERSFAKRASRREALLDAAIQLFALRGYQAVTMDDIGAAVGMRGPSVYGHFSSKADLLLAGHIRGAEGLQLSITRALGSADDANEALDRALESYITLNLEHPGLLRTLLTETIYLSEPDRHRLRGIQHDYVTEWVRLLLAVKPELTAAHGRVITHGVLGIINDNMSGLFDQLNEDYEERPPSWPAIDLPMTFRPGLQADLVGLGREILATNLDAGQIQARARTVKA